MSDAKSAEANERLDLPDSADSADQDSGNEPHFSWGGFDLGGGG
jgi:hypothetical protein